MPPLKLDTDILQAALLGLETRRADIEKKIQELRQALGSSGRVKPAAAVAAPRKRVLSPAARARISAAARKRWIEYRKANKGEQTA
jgi:hypothetical protein